LEQSVPSVLVADELPASLEISAAAFLAAGYHVRIAYDGLAALREINRACPDLVVATLSLPTIDGPTLGALAQGLGAEVVLVGPAHLAPAVPGTPYVPEPVAPQALLAAARRVRPEPGQPAA
jgi:DNA-binding NtrC family response regulator